MNYSINNIAKSLAAYLNGKLTATFYEDPIQQGASMPCCFLQQRSAKIEKRMDNRWLRTIQLDLTYLEDYNLTDLQTKYQAAAEVLDYCLETFPYLDGNQSTLLRTYNRDWSIDLDALHYKFELRVWVQEEEVIHAMQSLEQNEVINDV